MAGGVYCVHLLNLEHIKARDKSFPHKNMKHGRGSHDRSKISHVTLLFDYFDLGFSKYSHLIQLQQNRIKYNTLKMLTNLLEGFTELVMMLFHLTTRVVYQRKSRYI